jgi:hypothetical protein
MNQSGASGVGVSTIWEKGLRMRSKVQSMSQWGLLFVEWKEGERLDLGLGITEKKLMDSTEWHGVAVVRMEVELQKLGGKEIFEGVGGKNYERFMKC